MEHPLLWSFVFSVLISVPVAGAAVIVLGIPLGVALLVAGRGHHRHVEKALAVTASVGGTLLWLGFIGFATYNMWLGGGPMCGGACVP